MIGVVPAATDRGRTVERCDLRRGCHSRRHQADLNYRSRRVRTQSSIFGSHRAFGGVLASVSGK